MCSMQPYIGEYIIGECFIKKGNAQEENIILYFFLYNIRGKRRKKWRTDPDSKETSRRAFTKVTLSTRT